MQQWASQPWETNLLHVQGIDILQADEDVWVQKAITMFCPMSQSPTAKETEDKQLGYMLVKEGAFCGSQGEVLSQQVEDASHCAGVAQLHGYAAFMVGVWLRAGWCAGVNLEVDATLYSAWESEKKNPQCGAGWTSSRFYDFYAMEPIAD